MSNIFKLCPTNFSRGVEKFCKGGFTPLVTGLVSSNIPVFRIWFLSRFRAFLLLIKLFVSISVCRTYQLQRLRFSLFACGLGGSVVWCNSDQPDWKSCMKLILNHRIFTSWQIPEWAKGTRSLLLQVMHLYFHTITLNKDFLTSYIIDKLK